MARGVAKTPEERIADIESKKSEYQTKIENYREKIAELDKQIKELQGAKQQEEMSKLLDAIQKSGKSVEEVLAAVGGGSDDSE